jgi:hypothetical protein
LLKTRCFSMMSGETSYWDYGLNAVPKSARSDCSALTQSSNAVVRFLFFGRKIAHLLLLCGATVSFASLLLGEAAVVAALCYPTEKGEKRCARFFLPP